MKKQFTLLIVLLSTVFPLLAQDTITGIVNRITAPYFEQNVCNDRFAIVSENETYYVMVDNYWPNPYLEDLVIHYDTIAVGDEISVIGNILEMEDGHGEAFQNIDISKNLNSNHQQILGFFYYNDVSYPGPDPISTASFVESRGFELYTYSITINGELQAQIPFTINGRNLIEDKRYLFIGDSDVWTDYNGDTFNVFELIDALPYDVEDVSFEGILTMENDSHLLLLDGEENHYLTNKRKFIYGYINDAVFTEGDSVLVKGFVFIRHDLYGNPFKTLEVIKILSSTEHTLDGVAGPAGIPYTNIGPPIPGLCLALYSKDVEYFIRQPQYDEFYFYFDDYFVVGNDTIYVTSQQITASCYPGLFINNYIEPEYTVCINQVEFDGLEESYSPEIQIFPNPSDGIIQIVSEQSISRISVGDYTKRAVYNKTGNSNNIFIDLQDYKGLAIIHISFENGKTVSRKVVVL